MYVSWLQARGMVPATTILHNSGAKAYIRWRKKMGEVLLDFMDPDLPKIEYKQPIVLNEETLASFFAEVSTLKEPIRTVLTLMPMCGLRSDEMIRMKLVDVISSNGWVFFRVMGKGRKLRTVPLLKQGNKVLRTYLAEWRASRPADSEWLFPSSRGNKPITTRALRRNVQFIRHEISELVFTPHSLRKTYMTMLDASGISPIKIAQLGGHKKVETTRDHYIYHHPEAMAFDLKSVRVPIPSAVASPDQLQTLQEEDLSGDDDEDEEAAE